MALSLRVPEVVVAVVVVVALLLLLLLLALLHCRLAPLRELPLQRVFWAPWGLGWARWRSCGAARQ
jgi:hypothetical protein